MPQRPSERRGEAGGEGEGGVGAGDGEDPGAGVGHVLADASAATPARLAELLEERRADYEAATLTIDIADRSPIELAMLLMDRLGL